MVVDVDVEPKRYRLTYEGKQIIARITKDIHRARGSAKT